MAALAERTCQLTGYQSAQHLALLSKAVLATGRKDQAAIVAERAHNAALASGQTELAAAIAEYRRSIQQ